MYDLDRAEPLLYSGSQMIKLLQQIDGDMTVSNH